MVEYRCSDEECFEATQVLGKIYDSISKQFPEISNAPMVLTWLLYRCNLDHRVGPLYLDGQPLNASRMPGWDRLTRYIIPTIMMSDGDPESDDTFSEAAEIPKVTYRLIISHIFAKANEYSGMTLNIKHQ